MTNNTPAQILPDDCYLVTVVTKDYNTLSSFHKNEAEANQHIKDMTAADLNPEKGYIWVTSVRVKMGYNDLPRTPIAWVIAKQIS